VILYYKHYFEIKMLHRTGGVVIRYCSRKTVVKESNLRHCYTACIRVTGFEPQVSRHCICPSASVLPNWKEPCTTLLVNIK